MEIFFTIEISVKDLILGIGGIFLLTKSTSEIHSKFINNHPTLQMLALSFLILIGFMLILEAIGIHVPKGYIYFAIFFSLFVEILNMKLRKRSTPIILKQKYYDKSEKPKLK